MGPLVSKEQLERVDGYVSGAAREGARTAVGGQRGDNGGYYCQPTVVVDAAPHHRIVREEVFGPVVAVAPFHSLEQVLAAANDSAYGLAAAVWTRDLQKAHRVAHALKAGTVWVNTYHVYDNALPFGGYKQSGWGRELGPDAPDLGEAVMRSLRGPRLLGIVVGSLAAVVVAVGLGIGLLWL